MKSLLIQKIFIGIAIFSCFCYHGEMEAQGFHVAGVFGINASQIDGDDLAGYDKLGITSGLRIYYQTGSKLNASLELLYSQRGSSSELKFGSPVESQGISLNYIEIPLILTLNDWFQETEYYKVRAEAGLSYGYLFQVNSTNTFYDDAEEQFKTHDISYLFGLAYHLNKNVALAFRFTRSFQKMFQSENNRINGLLGYFITFRGEYHF